MWFYLREHMSVEPSDRTEVPVLVLGAHGSWSWQGLCFACLGCPPSTVQSEGIFSLSGDLASSCRQQKVLCSLGRDCVLTRGGTNVAVPVGGRRSQRSSWHTCGQAQSLPSALPRTAATSADPMAGDFGYTQRLLR